MKEYECVPYNGKMINSNGRQCNQLQQYTILHTNI